MSAYTDLTLWCDRVGGIKYRTRQTVPWALGSLSSGQWVEVPPGFVFDMSVPGALRCVFDPHDARFLKAACVHDFLLSRGWDWSCAAAEFNLALKADGIGRGKRLAMFLGVVFWRWQ